MSTFAAATKPPATKRNFRLLSYALGWWSAGLAVVQMVGFEDFVEALGQYSVAGERGTVAIAVVLLALEIFSIPFLFRMSVSKAARFVSALFAGILPYVWAALTVIVVLNGMTADKVGYFGGFLELRIGGLPVILNLLWMVAIALTFNAIGGTKALRGKI